MKLDVKFKDKYGPWAVVAGASEGLGAAYAETLANAGLNIILIARRKFKLNELRENLLKKYSNIEIETVPMNLNNNNDLLTFLDSETRDVGLLVYNAAYAPVCSFTELSREDIQAAVGVNVIGPSLMARHFSRKMKERGRGGIVLMSSLAGFQGSPQISVYGATKAYNTVLGEALWRELKEYSVDVTVCCAGAVRTPGYQQASSSREAPGTLDAKTVAEAALKALGRKPLIIPGVQNRFFRFILGKVFSRRRAVNIMFSQTRGLS